MAHWVGDMGKPFWPKWQKHTLIVPQRTPNPKRKDFLKSKQEKLAESVQDLNSSQAQSTGELWPEM